MYFKMIEISKCKNTIIQPYFIQIIVGIFFSMLAAFLS